MNKFLEGLLDAVKSGVEESVVNLAKKVFDAGVAYGQGTGPDFETWRAENRAKREQASD